MRGGRRSRCAQLRCVYTVYAWTRRSESRLRPGSIRYHLGHWAALHRVRAISEPRAEVTADKRPELSRSCEKKNLHKTKKFYLRWLCTIICLIGGNLTRFLKRVEAKFNLFVFLNCPARKLLCNCIRAVLMFWKKRYIILRSIFLARGSLADRPRWKNFCTALTTVGIKAGKSANKREEQKALCWDRNGTRSRIVEHV